jgi:hypothetical protein
MIQKRFIAFILFAVVALSANTLHAQWVKANGPDSGTHVVSLNVSGANIFAGTSDSGVFLSTDYGATWTAASTGLPSGGYDYTMSGANLFAENYDGGVFHSTDNGATWSAASTRLPTGSILGVLAASSTNLFVGTVNDGVFRSNDYGASWASCPGTEGCPADVCIAVSGKNIFVSTVINGVIRSTDNGVSFTISANDLAIGSLAVSGTNLLGESYGGGGVYLSTDNANNWTPVPTLSNFTSLASTGTDIFAGTDNGVFLSTDNGASWTPVSGLPNTNISSLVVSGTNLFAATDSNGLWQRPLSDFGTAAVSPVTTIQNSIQSYPNPFNQSTQISFTSESAGYADVSIVNLLGEQVAHVFSGELDAGSHNFTFINTTALPDGSYECLIRMNGRVETLPMVLLH